MSTITIDDHQLPFDTHNEYDVHIGPHSIHTLLTFCPHKVNEWFTKIQTTPPSPPLLVGLDIEWKPNRSKNQDNPAATLQLCISQNCLIFQLLYCSHFPKQLLDFLANKELTFVGVGIEHDVEKLVEDCGFAFGGKLVDLGCLASEKRGDGSLKKAGLKGLAKEVLGLEVEKPKRVACSRWDQEWLYPDQVKYACVDAFLSFEIGRVLGAAASG
ncbi:hypothetical protein Leryth_001189 [Lithospermum erythrorhizon]|nr:hypothetical protein Leryth_001189 [Lithospermum erythrorhizon]